MFSFLLGRISPLLLLTKYARSLCCARVCGYELAILGAFVLTAAVCRLFPRESCSCLDAFWASVFFCVAYRYALHLSMIIGFRHKGLEAFYHTDSATVWPRCTSAQ